MTPIVTRIMHDAKRGIKKRTRKQEGDGGGSFETPEEEARLLSRSMVERPFRDFRIALKKYTFMRQGHAGLETPLRLI